MQLAIARAAFILGVVAPACALATRLPGQDVLRTFSGDLPALALGWSVAGAGDVDRDGFADVILGAPIHFFVDVPVVDALQGRVLAAQAIFRRPVDRWAWT